MKTMIATLVITLCTLISVPAPAAADGYRIDPDRYGALAYSPKTGKYGYSWNHGTRAAAERAALNECKADDAKVLTWVRFGWAALVIAEDNAYGYDEVHGDGVCDRDAIDSATNSLRKHSQAKIKTIVVICSGDVKPKVINN